MIINTNNLMMNKEEISSLNIWSKIPPFWPLKNLIATNPLLGFDDLPFEEALQKGAAYFQKTRLPEKMKDVNRETIKWLQLYLDQGQASIQMPLRELGFLKAMLQLLPFDKKILRKRRFTREFELTKLLNNSIAPETIISNCLLKLNIPEEKKVDFLILMLTTLPGWASYINYLNDWSDKSHHPREIIVDRTEYLAFRMLLTSILWPEAKELIDATHSNNKSKSIETVIEKIVVAEKNYQDQLLSKLHLHKSTADSLPKAQLVFCIDVRSEPFRRALEAQGDYETFGFAGFFGIPISIENSINGDHYASCPVLIKPKHKVIECLETCSKNSHQSDQKLKMMKRLFHSIKYNFTTPFVLVEILGSLAGSWIALRTLFPKLAYYLKSKSLELSRNSTSTQLLIDSISFEERCKYASTALRMIGLIKDFAPLVIFCGHGSQTQNNTYGTALDCGACGGRPGAPNARILATILNDLEVRKKLAQEGIIITDKTYFLAGQHNTTTDEVEFFTEKLPIAFYSAIEELKKNLELARAENTQWRCEKFGKKYSKKEALEHSLLRSRDWAQVRPEWGLAKNASMIIGPRSLTKKSNLDGRSFLHSYNYQIDPEGKFLEAILTAPMIVAHWINMQYFFSTLDNVAYGTGSKITKNITGKIGIMQGNASDLMNGLPLQSVYQSDTEPYHELLRLLTVVYAPRIMIQNAINKNSILQKLFFNGWVSLACMDPEEKKTYLLQRDNTWRIMTPIT